MMLAKILGGPIREKAITDSGALADALRAGSASKAGVVVSVEAALRVSTAFACVRAVAEDIAQIPLKLMREEKSGKKSPAREHPLYDVTSLRPNGWQSSHQFRETLGMHAALVSGGFSYINRVGGEVRELLPFPPGVVRPKRDTPRQWEPTYEVEAVGDVPASDLLRIEGPSWNGYQAMSLVMQAREALGLAMATETAQAGLHGNGVRPGGLLSKDAEIQKDQKERTREKIQAAYGGSEKAGKLLVLDGGWKFQTFAMTGVDAQTLESRRFQIEEIARMFGVPPTRIGYSDKATTYASAEQFALAYVKHTIGPWASRWEQALSLSLLTPEERRAGLFFHFVLDGLLRGDWAARSAYFKAGLGTASSPGWLSPNDVRRLEDLDPSDQDGASDLVTVKNMSGKQGQQQDPAEPADPAKDPGEDAAE